MTEPALLNSSDAGGVSAQALTPAPSTEPKAVGIQSREGNVNTSGTSQPSQGEEPNPTRRVRKREKLSEDGSHQQELRWGLKQKIAAITQDIELLSQEVAKVRREADGSCATPELTAEENAVLADRHTKRLAELHRRGISVLLRDMMSHKWAFPFNRPVDTVMYSDYPLKISTPMDFGTIKARLEAGMYTVNAEGFTTDMRQVFTNAFIYNAPGSDVNSMAMTLQDKFEDRMKGLAQRMAAAENERAKEENEMVDAARRRLQEKALEGLSLHSARLEPILTTLDNRMREAKSEAAKGCTFMTWAEKQALVDALAELKLEEFEFAIQLVVDRHPGMLPPNSEEMDIDLEPLDSLTLRQLSSFCRACRQGRSSGVSPGWPGLLFGAGAPGFLPPIRRRSAQQIPEEGATTSSSQNAATDVQAAHVPPAEGDTAPAAVSTAQEAAAAAAERATQSREDPVVVQMRSIGERSWSTLNQQKLQMQPPQQGATATEKAPQQVAAAPPPANPGETE